MSSDSNVPVLVTGGAGYIGSHAILALREAGYPVVVIDNLSTGERRLVPKDVPLVVGNIADQELVSAVISEHKCKAAMHFAGSIIVPESIIDPLKYYANNTATSRDLIACCVREGIEAFIFSSTATVYGNPQCVPLPETAETLPVNPYGTSKLMTEWMLRDVSAATGMHHAILRYFNVAGADPAGRSGQSGPDSSHLIRVACELIVGKRSKMSVFGTDYTTPDGTCIRDYVHVSDLAEAHVLALEHLLRHGENVILNCGYGHGFSVWQVIDVVRKLVGRELAIHMSARRAGDAEILVSDSRKIRETLDWKPRFDDLETIVSTALDWERKRV